MQHHPTGPPPRHPTTSPHPTAPPPPSGDKRLGGHTFRYNSNRHALDPFQHVRGGKVPLDLIVGEDTGVHGAGLALSIAYLWWHYLAICIFPRQVSVGGWWVVGGGW